MQTRISIFIFAALFVSARAADDTTKPEIYLLVPEPKAGRALMAKELGGARQTVFTPARQGADLKSVKLYSEAEFRKLGISWDTFYERARAAADRRLLRMTPEVIKKTDGNVAYAVYRGPDSSIASLLTAPSLGKIFAKTFGDALWVITPDRNSLYIFPAKAEALAEYAADLKIRFSEATYAASPEIFEIKAEGGSLRAVGGVAGR